MEPKQPGVGETVEEPHEESEERVERDEHGALEAEKRRFKHLESEVLEDGDEILVTGDDELLAAAGGLVYDELGGTEWSAEEAEAQLKLGVTLKPRGMRVTLNHKGLHVEMHDHRGDEKQRTRIAGVVDKVLEG